MRHQPWGLTYEIWSTRRNTWGIDHEAHKPRSITVHVHTTPSDRHHNSLDHPVWLGFRRHHSHRSFCLLRLPHAQYTTAIFDANRSDYNHRRRAHERCRLCRIDKDTRSHWIFAHNFQLRRQTSLDAECNNLVVSIYRLRPLICDARAHRHTACRSWRKHWIVHRINFLQLEIVANQHRFSCLWNHPLNFFRVCSVESANKCMPSHHPFSPVDNQFSIVYSILTPSRRYYTDDRFYYTDARNGWANARCPYVNFTSWK